MHLGEQPFFHLYTHFVLIIIGRDLGRIHNIILIFVGLLYSYTHHWGVHFFVTSRCDFAIKRFFVFLIHTVFVGQSRGNGVINRSEIWPRKPWGEHLAPGPPNIIIYVGIHIYTIYIRQFLPYYYRHHAQNRSIGEENRIGGDTYIIMVS